MLAGMYIRYTADKQLSSALKFCSEQLFVSIKHFSDIAPQATNFSEGASGFVPLG